MIARLVPTIEDCIFLIYTFIFFIVLAFWNTRTFYDNFY